MKISALTRQTLCEAFRQLRRSRVLTQKQVADRALPHKDLGFGRLLESQVSDFERGRTLPSFRTFLVLLAACSENAEEVAFSDFERALGAVVDELDELSTLSVTDLPAHVKSQETQLQRLEAELFQLRRRVDLVEVRLEESP